MRQGGERRGNTTDRRRRREWLVATFGDGTLVDCALRSSPRCTVILTVDTVTADRILPGCEGGSYERSNLRPACIWCNREDGTKLSVRRRAALAQMRSGWPKMVNTYLSHFGCEHASTQAERRRCRLAWRKRSLGGVKVST